MQKTATRDGGSLTNDIGAVGQMMQLLAAVGPALLTGSLAAPV